MHTPLKKTTTFLCLKTASLRGGERGGGAGQGFEGRSTAEGGEVVGGGRKKIQEG